MLSAPARSAVSEPRLTRDWTSLPRLKPRLARDWTSLPRLKPRLTRNWTSLPRLKPRLTRHWTNLGSTGAEYPSGLHARLSVWKKI
jgi:hypothetical protein